MSHPRQKADNNSFSRQSFIGLALTLVHEYTYIHKILDKYMNATLQNVYNAMPTDHT